MKDKITQLTCQPISFDEFISKALASGITHRSYKARLAKFLDQQVSRNAR